VALFAPARCYGTPDDLRTLVDTAHGLGLAVCLDVVYNHLGPDGAYLSAFSPDYFTERHQTPWGAGLNFDGDGNAMVRRFFIENACHWVHEYRFDALRLDATHAIADDNRQHVIAELTARVRASVDRRVVIVAEDHRNLAAMLKPASEGGWGLDAVWADDFHHQARRLLAGDTEGYYADFTGSAGDLAETIRRGWFYTGQVSSHLGGPRGTDPVGIPASRFVVCLQNHDQIGNRALGERLNHQIEPAAYRAASALLLMAPETPLLFMGQEWAATTPFLYFTEHHPELGALVTEGRRAEFRHFSAFSDPAVRERIPDPQAESTFLASRLQWRECTEALHAATRRFYQALLTLRRSELALHGGGGSFSVVALDAGTLALRRADATAAFQVVVRLTGSGSVLRADHALGPPGSGGFPAGGWSLVLSTEDPAFCVDPTPPGVVEEEAGLRVTFARPGAVVFRTGAGG
jgi:maltooligosyltrehalose trehalohydrolase